MREGKSNQAPPSQLASPSPSDANDRRSEGPQLRVCVQGGGMRVAYGLGAMLALRSEAPFPIASFSCSSAGSVAPLVYLSRDPQALIERIFTMLSGKRFINPRRIHRVADIDYFVDEVLGADDFNSVGAPGAPEVWVSIVGARSAVLRHVRFTPETARELLRATSAVPVLYGRAVPLPIGGTYVDGGVGDAIPLVHALGLAAAGDVVVATATKPLARLEDPARPRSERIAVRIDRRISGAVRHLLLAPNPLVTMATHLIRQEHVAGVPILLCEPTDESLNFSRTMNSLTELWASCEQGRADMTNTLSRIVGST